MLRTKFRRFMYNWQNYDGKILASLQYVVPANQFQNM